jgi:uncharacterized protein YerC
METILLSVSILCLCAAALIMNKKLKGFVDALLTVGELQDENNKVFMDSINELQSLADKLKVPVSQKRGGKKEVKVKVKK